MRVRDLTDQHTVATIDGNGEVVWRRIDPETRRSLGAAVCEARYEPQATVRLDLTEDLVARLLDVDRTDTAELLSSVRLAILEALHIEGTL